MRVFGGLGEHKMEKLGKRLEFLLKIWAILVLFFGNLLVASLIWRELYQIPQLVGFLHYVLLALPASALVLVIILLIVRKIARNVAKRGLEYVKGKR